MIDTGVEKDGVARMKVDVCSVLWQVQSTVTEVEQESWSGITSVDMSVASESDKWNANVVERMQKISSKGNLLA